MTFDSSKMSNNIVMENKMKMFEIDWSPKYLVLRRLPHSTGDTFLFLNRFMGCFIKHTSLSENRK